MDIYGIEQHNNDDPIIKVVGVGGGGGNAVNNMVLSALKGVTFISANTDSQALRISEAEHKIQLGIKLTKGLGAGARPHIGCDAAMESIDHIRAALEGADMIFVTAGMGGGTGSGAAPVIAQVAKEVGALTVGVVTKPFFFEGKKRQEVAIAGIEEFRKHVDSLITIPNNRLIQLAPKNATFKEMLLKADEVLLQAVKGIADLINITGLINLDFADVQTVMGVAGLAMMGTGCSSGESRAKDAATKAITCPLLEDITMDGARNVLVNITCGSDMRMDEVAEATTIIQEAAHPDANILWGTVSDDSMGDEMRITVIATGIDPNPAQTTGIKDFQLTNPRAPRGQIPQGRVFAEPVVSPPPVAPAPQADYSNIDPALRDRVVKKAEQPRGINFEQPAYKRDIRSMTAHTPGAEEFIFDEDEIDTPAFLKRQAN